jgi:protein TonB
MFYLAPTIKKLQRCLVILFPLLFISAGHIKAQKGKSLHPTAIAHAENGSDSARDGLSGPVRRVRTEVADLLFKDGKPVESPRVLVETSIYNRQGKKVDHSIYAVSSAAPIGKEVYKYDTKGNLVEMTVRDDNGSIVSQEIYAYEFDALGNWTKMTTSVAVIENNNTTYEPTEITFRAITYYRTDAVAKALFSGAVNKKLQSPTDGEMASGQSVAAPANKEDGRPPTTPDETGSDAVTEKIVGGGASSKSERSVAEQPVAEQPEPKPPVNAVSGGVLNGRAINLPKPIYTNHARSSGQEGIVSVEIIIDVTGKVISAKAVSGPELLRDAAEDAARQAQFSPTLLSGQPMRISGVINYRFSLKK